MTNYCVKCNYEKVYVALIDVDLPEDEEELGLFMEEFEDENEVDWKEVQVFFEYSGYEA